METWLLPAFLFLLAAWNLVLVIPSGKRPGILGVFPFLVLTAGGLQIWYQGFFWFLLPAYVLSAVEALIFAGSLVLNQDRRPLLLGPARALYLVPALVACSLAVAAAISVPLAYAKYTGPWTPSYARFTEGNGLLGVYYPLGESGAEQAGPLPRKKYFWENHLDKIDTGIRKGGRPPSGNWSLVVVHGVDTQEDSQILLWADLASWGFVVVVQEDAQSEEYNGSTASWDTDTLTSLGLRAFRKLGIGWSGTKAGIFFREPGGEGWSARIFPGSFPSEVFPGVPDLVFSSGPVPEEGYGALYSGAREFLLGDEPLVRPWLRYTGLVSEGSETLRLEAGAAVRDFLLWKLRQGEPGLFSRSPESPGRLRILSPR